MDRGRDQKGRVPSSLLEHVDAHLWPHFLCRRHERKALELLFDGTVELLDLVSWGDVAIFTITSICRRRRREGYGLGAVSSCDATLECMYTGAARYNYQRSRQGRFCDANMDGDRGNRKGIATAYVQYREGIHVQWARVSIQHPDVHFLRISEIRPPSADRVKSPKV